MSLLGKVLGFIFRIAAGCIIVLALLVGVARLLLPEAASLTDEIKDGVRLATGFSIDFDFISAGVSFYGPELRLRGVNITWPDGGEILVAERLAVSIDVIDSIAMRKLMPERIRVVGADIDAEISAEGEVYLQGRSWRELLPPDSNEEEVELPEFRLQLEDIGFTFRNLQRAGPEINGRATTLGLLLDDGQVEFLADLSPGEELGRRLQAEAQLPLELLTAPDTLPEAAPWNLSLYIQDFRLDPWLRLIDMRDLPVIGSQGDAEARLEFRGRELVAIETELDLEEVVLSQPEGGPVVLDYIEGELVWRASSGGWLASGESFSIGRGERNWPASAFNIRYSAGPEAGRKEYLADVSFARIDDLVPFVRALDPDALAEAGFRGEAQGDLNAFKAEVSLLDGRINEFRVETEFAALGYTSPEQGVDLVGYTGALTADQNGGDISLATRSARFGLTRQFRDTIQLTELDGVAVWRASEQGYRIIANDLKVRSPHAQARASLELSLDADFGSPMVDLNGTASMEDVTNLPGYLPLILGELVIDWLDESLLAGQVPDATYRLRGPLNKFPFDDGEGMFRAEVNFTAARLDYAPEWPLLEEASGRIVFDRGSLYSDQNAFLLMDIPMQNAAVRIADLRNPALVGRGSAAADMTQVIALLRASPVAAALGPVFADIYASGDATADVVLTLPILDLDNWQFDADFVLNDVTAGMEGIDPEFSQLWGRGSVSNIYVTLPGANAVLLGDPVTIAVTPDDSAGAVVSHRADVSGELSVTRIWDAFGMPPTTLLGGRVPIDAQALFPADEDANGQQFRILLNSNLVGAVSNLPFPLSKPALDSEAVSAELTFPDDDRIDFTGSFRTFNWAMQLEEDNTGWFIERGNINRDEPPPGLPAKPGLNISAYLERLEVQEWYDAFTDKYWPPVAGGEDDFADWEQTFRLIDLRIDELFVVNHRFIDAGLQAKPLANRWDISLSGPWMKGNVLVPFDFSGTDILKIDMERLLLIEPLEGEDDYSDELDPRDFPSMRGTIDDFALDTMRFGELEMDLRRTPDGLRSALLNTKADSFTTESSTDWVVVDNAQRTRLHSELRSKDFEETLKDLDYSPYMSADRAKVVTNLLWEGMPDSRVLTDSTGTIELTIKDGVINEVEPGGGRLLGLVSIAALPRRLSMDFSEITESGLVFDELKGTFRIDFGDAWTCDLGLEGNIADMGVVGRIGIRNEDYDQVAVVRPHVSNIAPVAGVVLGGPVIGVATLLITQIFKKPLSGIGGSYFTITGSWDDPLVTEAEGSDINTAKFSECKAGLPNLSPEEIQAMQDLMQKEESAAPSPPRAKIGPLPE